MPFLRTAVIKIEGTLY